MTTPLEWSDLVLDEVLSRQIETIVSWVKHSKMLMEDWKLGRWLKPGYRALFLGPPGTGKTLAALLIEVDVLFAGDDRAANQQMAYLLQRLEDYPGLAIVTGNLRDRMDEAFRRRFESVIHFEMPDAAARLALWQRYFGGDPLKLSDDVDLAALAERHVLSGGSIANALRYAALKAAERGAPVIHAADLEEGARLGIAKST